MPATRRTSSTRFARLATCARHGAVWVLFWHLAIERRAQTWPITHSAATAVPDVRLGALTTTAMKIKGPEVTGTVLGALLAQRGGFVVQDCTEVGNGVVHGVQALDDWQQDDPDILVLMDDSEAAERTYAAGGTSAAARSLTAVYANAAARGLM